VNAQTDLIHNHIRPYARVQVFLADNSAAVLNKSSEQIERSATDSYGATVPLQGSLGRYQTKGSELVRHRISETISASHDAKSVGISCDQATGAAAIRRVGKMPQS
jgi:hypothetical protein